MHFVLDKLLLSLAPSLLVHHAQSDNSSNEILDHVNGYDPDIASKALSAALADGTEQHQAERYGRS